MRKLCLGLSFASMVLLAACGGDSGSGADDFVESSSSGEVDVIGSCASDESMSNSSKTVDSSISEESSSSEQGDLSSSNSENSSSNESEDSSSSGNDESSSSKEPSSSNDKVSSSEEKSSSSVSLSSSAESIYDATANTLTDLRDGQVYRTTTIAPAGSGYSEVWMAENLNYETANSYCYNDNASNCTKYGRLYTWAAAMDSVGTWSINGKGCGNGTTCSPRYPVRGVCPQGWHLPFQSEWYELFKAVGGESSAGIMLKSASGWNKNGGGADDYGFSALPAGLRYGLADYDYEGNYAYFWTSADFNNGNAYSMYLYYYSGTVYPYNHYKFFGFSVRCLKD